jgi:hypothetical protein
MKYYHLETVLATLSIGVPVCIRLLSDTHLCVPLSNGGKVKNLKSMFERGRDY